MEYKQEKINVKLKTMSGWFFLFRPVLVPYDKLAEKKVGEMWEKSVAFGKGWIGAPHSKGNVEIVGEFNTYVHKGSYTELGKTFQQIMKDHPQAREFYSVYLNNPRKVKPEELETKIIFR